MKVAVYWHLLLLVANNIIEAAFYAIHGDSNHANHCDARVGYCVKQEEDHNHTTLYVAAAVAWVIIVGSSEDTPKLNSTFIH